MLFFAHPPQGLGGPPSRRPAQGRPPYGRQQRAQFVERGIGLGHQTGPQLRLTKRAHQRSGAAASRQGGERTARALATQELVGEGERHHKPGGYRVNFRARLDAGRRHSFPQIK